MPSLTTTVSLVLVLILAMLSPDCQRPVPKRGRRPHKCYETVRRDEHGRLHRDYVLAPRQGVTPEATAALAPLEQGAAGVDFEQQPADDAMFETPDIFNTRQQLSCCPDPRCPDANPAEKQAGMLAKWLCQAAKSTLPEPIAWDQHQTTYCVTEPTGNAHIVSFRTVAFANGSSTLGWCTCEHDLRLVQDAYCGVTSVEWSIEEDEGRAHYCVHARALKTACRFLDVDPSCLHPWKGQSRLQEGGAAVQQLLLPDGRTRWIVGDPLGRDAAICSRSDSGAVNCVTCPRTRRCWHAQAVVEHLGGPEPHESVDASDDQVSALQAQLSKYLDDAGRMKATCVSKEPIPDMFAPCDKPRMYLEAKDLGDTLETVVDPESSCDGCGLSWSLARTCVVPTRRPSIVYSLTWAKTVTLVGRQCSCGALHLNIDGYGLLNYNQVDIFSHELLRRYSIDMATAGTPFYTFWSSVVNTYADRGLFERSGSHFGFYMNKCAEFQGAWVSFTALQQPHFASAFQCTCPDAEKYQAVICDGILLGHRQGKGTVVAPWSAGPNTQPKAGSLHDQRVMFNKATRDKLAPLWLGGPNSGMAAEEYNEVSEQLREHSVAPYLALVEEVDGNLVKATAPAHVKAFMRELLSNSPVCAVLPGTVHEDVDVLLCHASSRPTPRTLRRLAESAPILYGFIVGELGSGRPRLPPDAVNIISKTLEVAKACYIPADVGAYARATVKRAANAQLPEAAPAGAEDWTDDQAFLHTGAYYPALPVQRNLGRYLADYRGQRAGAHCTKYHYDSKNLTPGLFVMHCLKCSACLGFHKMDVHESPRTLFEVLFTRLPKPPRVVVYDNSCNAQVYFLNREPAWARDILFLVDKLHMLGHTACARSHDVGRYPEFTALNSQLAEQRNSRLAALKSHCAYMTQSMFLVYVRYFLYMSNRLGGKQRLGST